MVDYSYWEVKEWFKNIDFTIVGSGIVGLNCAFYLRQKYPNAKILIIEKGVLPQGASTKNAGFACFGSLSELIDDMKRHTEEEVFNLVKKRLKGLQLLKNNLGEKEIAYQRHKGYELFFKSELFDECLDKKDKVNSLLQTLFKKPVFKIDKNIFNFKQIYKNYITNNYEGQIDTGIMMAALLKTVINSNIQILNATELIAYEENLNEVIVKTNRFEFISKKLLFATNGFSQKLLDEEVKPARAQVLITKPIKDLSIKGTFHLDRGYYYFRNIDSRILLGGGRNLDFKSEETTVFAQTDLIQNKLEAILNTIILPDQKVEIEQRWNGIMGVGSKKKAIVKQISNNVYCGIRLGGMGVAIGSIIGKDLAEMAY